MSKALSRRQQRKARARAQGQGLRLEFSPPHPMGPRWFRNRERYLQRKNVVRTTRWICEHRNTLQHHVQ